MQVGQLKYTTSFGRFRLGDRAVTILNEIGLDEISTATSFIEYFCEKYGMSRSGAWYCLKKLKKEGVVEFREKGEEYKPLRMTERGLEVLRASPRIAQVSASRPPMIAMRAMTQATSGRPI